MIDEKTMVPSKFISTYGIILIVMGAFCIIMPLLASVIIEWLLGGTLIAFGLVLGASSFHSREWGGGPLRALEALLCMVFGVYLLFNPLKGVAFMALVMAGFFLAGGMFRIIAALQMRNVKGWQWMLVGGAVNVVLGGFIWGMWPINSAVIFATLFGVNFIFTGFSLLAMGKAVQQIGA